ncbi:GNAT family N-acetyltransferase [Salinicoccus albus]|uniref:GNAT family N-acetyltransferase n=1 Tax=Salinicoccus albus TaxID=418756 RepID=UPI00037D0285|nr:GNAT family N-acetyltransferase [Salinicoccus albus]
MNTSFLSDRPEYITEVAMIIHERFDLDENIKGNYKEAVEFFGGSTEKGYPITLIDLEGRKCVGTVSIYKNDLTERPNYQPWLAALYVLPGYRGEGIADRLVSDMLEHISELGFEIIYARTDSQKRYDYYMQKGWELLETIHTDGQKTFIFRKGKVQ